MKRICGCKSKNFIFAGIGRNTNSTNSYEACTTYGYACISIPRTDTWCAIEPDQLGLNILSDDYCFLCIVKENLSCLQ